MACTAYKHDELAATKKGCPYCASNVACGDSWIVVKQGCDLPEDCADVQLFVDDKVTAGYYVYPMPYSRGGTTFGGWMEYTLKGSADCTPSHWQPMASAPIFRPVLEQP